MISESRDELPEQYSPVKVHPAAGTIATSYYSYFQSCFAQLAQI